MSRTKNQLYFSLFTLVALLVIAYFVGKQNGWFGGSNASDESPNAEFVISDTAAIDQFIITRSKDNTKATLTRKGADWIINNGSIAKPECINLILKTFKNVRVKSRVGVGARNNIIRNLGAYHTKVQIFSKGEWIKTWYLGNASVDREGSYCLLETPDKGKSNEPFIVELAGFHGQLDVRFFTEEEDWKFTGIYNYNPSEIREIKVMNREIPQDGFTLQINEAGKLVLLDNNGGKINGFDTLTARAYTYEFKKIHFEHYAKLLGMRQVDSLKKITPYFTIEVTDKNHVKKKISIYQMANHAKSLDLDGKPYQYNPERAYALLPSGEFVVIQYYVFDAILRPITAFMMRNNAPK